MFDMDVNRLIDYHKKKKAVATLVVHPNSHPYDSDLVMVDKDGKVNGFLKKNEERTEWANNIVNSGLFILEKEAINDINSPTKLDMEKDIVSGLICKGRVYAYRTSEYIKDAGTPDRFIDAEKEKKDGIWEARNLENRQKCIFLDRDGTVNKYVGLVSNPDEMELEERAAEAVRMINLSGYLSILITNQPVVARGLCTEDELKVIHRKLETLLGKEGAYLDDIEYCPHHPDRGFPEENVLYKVKCECRKPKTGMIDRMIQKYNIDVSRSFFIGDTTTDIITGLNAGLHTVLLRTGEGGRDGKYNVEPEIIAEDLFEAINGIVCR